MCIFLRIFGQLDSWDPYHEGFQITLIKELVQINHDKAANTNFDIHM